MDLKQAHIYPYIQDQLQNMPIIHVAKGTYFSNAEDRDKQIYYILDGEVKVESISDMGKKILVDYISDNEFAGQISYIRKSNFYANSLAVTNLTLLCLKHEVMEVLMKNPEFATVFYYKTSSRIYLMYKKMLMSNLFNQCEIVAYYILENCKGDEFVFKSVYDICEQLNISRRNFYNILNTYLANNIVTREIEGQYHVKDLKYLKDKSEKVKRFLENSL